MLDKHNIILIGPQGAGKTQIFNRLTVSKKKFETAHKVRLGFIPASMKYVEKNLQIVVQILSLSKLTLHY